MYFYRVRKLKISVIVHKATVDKPIPIVRFISSSPLYPIRLHGAIGFPDDLGRLNVALTWTKAGAIIIGDATPLAMDPNGLTGGSSGRRSHAGGDDGNASDGWETYSVVD